MCEAVSSTFLLFMGHLSIDRVRNMHGEHVQLGGAALYAAMGARVLTDNVRIISAVGKDFTELNTIYKLFPHSLIKRVAASTTRFNILYDEKFNAEYVSSSLGAGRLIRADNIPAQWLSGREYVHLAPMHPNKTLKIVKRLRRLSPRTWISVNSNIQYMGDPKNRKILRSVAEMADLFVVNDRETCALSETANLPAAVGRIPGRRVAVTLGEIGAIIKEDGKINMIPALGGLTSRPKDTTGAGDTWSGALLAAYALTKDWTKSVVAACIISAVKCLDWGFERLKTLRLTHPDELVDYVLRIREGKGQLTLRDFLERKM